MTSCTKDTDLSGGTARSSQDVQKTYEEAFLSTFGRPVEGLDWGFGISSNNSNANTRAITRGDMPSKPTFSDGTGGVPTFSKPQKRDVPTFYNTVSEAKQAGVTVVPAEGEKVKPVNNTTYSINGGTTLEELQNSSGITLYITDNMTLNAGFSASGNTIVVTKGKTLKLGSLSQKVSVYLAEGATLELTQDVTFDNNGTSTEARLYLSTGSTLTASSTGTNVTFKNYYHVINDGGTITEKINNLTLEKSELWNEGDITISGNLNTINGDVSIYNKGDLTINGNLTLYKVPFWNEGSVDIEGNLATTEGNNKIYNAANKTIDVTGTVQLTNNGDIIYNNGTFTSTGSITMKDGSNQIINNGTLNSSGDLDMTAGGAFHNVGYSTISGHTYVYNTNSKWMNDGHFTTGSFEDKNCLQVYNNCYMTVTGNFTLDGIEGGNGHPSFVMEGSDDQNVSGAYLYCDSYTFGDDADLWMGSKSFIEVEKSFLTTNNDAEWGIHGVGSEYAVIKAASFTKQGNPYISMTYYGKLYIDTPVHYPKGTDDINPYYRVNDEWVQFSFNNDPKPVKIPRTDCNPGYNNGGGGGGVDPDATAVRVVAEDLTTYITSDGKELADFDFNDVVFDVSKSHNADCTNTSGVHIVLRAAGGTLPLTVGGTKGETELDKGGNEVYKYEVHRLFKVSTGTMVNTNSTSNGATRDAVEFDVDYPEGVGSRSTIYAIANAIPIRVYRQDLSSNKGEWIEIRKAQEVQATSESSATGITASKLCVDKTFQWCDERIHIDQEFPCTDAYGNNKGSRFRMYLKGELSNYWWKEDK
jgi:hypothetical protein